MSRLDTLASRLRRRLAAETMSRASVSHASTVAAAVDPATSADDAYTSELLGYSLERLAKARPCRCVYLRVTPPRSLSLAPAPCVCA